MLTIALIAGLARGLIHTTETAFIAEMYPTHARTAGLSVSYQFDDAIFAAAAFLIMTWIPQQEGGKPGAGLLNASIYIVVLCLPTAVIIGIFRERT